MNFANAIWSPGLLFCIPSLLFSMENASGPIDREVLTFTDLLSSGGSTKCPSTLSVNLVNSYLELGKAINYLYECSSRIDPEVELPDIDLVNGSAVLLDLGFKASLGHDIMAIEISEWKNSYTLTFATLEPGEGCWLPAQSQRPFQLVYVREKIHSLDTRHERRIEACTDD